MNADEAEAAEWRANSAMIEEKARSLLNRNERHVLRLCCSAYKSRQIDVDHYVDTLLGLLTTPSKMTFLVELRELVREQDKDRYDDLVFSASRPVSYFRRPVQFQSDNNFDFEMADLYDSRQCLLQVNVHKSGNKFRDLTSGTSKRAKEIKVKDSRLRTFKETRINLPHLDMTSAFPPVTATPAPSTGAIPVEDPVKRHQQQAQRQQAQRQQSNLQQQRPTTNRHVVNQHVLRHMINRPMFNDNDELLQVVVVKNTHKILGIAIEGGADTKHRLPRIINIDGKGTAFEAAGLKVGQTIVEVDGTRMEGLSHDDAAKVIAEAYANRQRKELTLTVTANSFRAHAERYRPNS